MNTIEMKAIHKTALMATGTENEPRWKGPRVNRPRYITRNAIGTPAMIQRE